MNLKSTDQINHKTRQKYLGDKGIVALIVFLTAFIPLATDLYLPALPNMAVYFKAPVNLVNLTLILFFIFFALGTLFWGPLSDKYGRKPVLITGLAIFTASSIMCARAADIYQLIFFRIMQALGSGAPTAIATALVKDIYAGHRRESILAIVQSMVVIIPIIAPSLGALLLQFTSWRGIFWFLALTGLITILISIMLEETLKDRHKGTILQTIARLGTVLKNPGFTSLLFIFSFLPVPMMAFLASSSYIYINGFGLSEQAYSLFFAMNAIVASSGPFVYLSLLRRFRRKSIILACFAMIIVSGIMIYFFGNTGPFIFAGTMVPASIFLSALRPPGMNLMLEQQKADTGSASSLMLCCGMLTGSIGMFVISFKWANMISILGILHILIGILSGILWLLISGKSYIRHAPEPAKKSTEK